MMMSYVLRRSRLLQVAIVLLFVEVIVLTVSLCRTNKALFMTASVTVAKPA